MKIIAVDDERLALDNILMKLEKLQQGEGAVGFQVPADALEYLRYNDADVAFLDISMSQMDGLTLAKKIKDIRPNVHIVFLTGYSEYAVDAFRMHAAGYLMKPASIEEIRDELEHIAHPAPTPVSSKCLRVQTFGNFEVFAQGTPVRFRYNKTKELLAYLVNRKGAGCSMTEIASVLWEDRPDSLSVRSQMRNLISDLTQTMKSLGFESVIIKNRNSIAIVADKLECDYFDWLSGDAAAVNAYFGEYMSNYSWAEFTTGYLDQGRS